MGRRSRRLLVRLRGLVGAALVGCVLYERCWCARRGAVQPMACPLPPRTRANHWAELQASSSSNGSGHSYDLLVVGGTLVGLYTATDAAQRGLRVALVEAGDFGDDEGAQPWPSLEPGAFPYLCDVLQQRTLDGLWLAVRRLRASTLWSYAAPHCCYRSVNHDAVALEGDGATVASWHRAFPATYTFYPAHWWAQRVMYAAVAVMSTALASVCGPLRPCWLVSRQAADEVFGGQDAHEGGGSSSTSAALYGGALSNDLLLDGAAAAVALARTAEALGVTVLNYAAVTGFTVDGATALAVVEDRSEVDWQQKTRPRATVRTRAVVNCAGTRADEIKALVPNNEAEPVAAVFARQDVYTYLVLPYRAMLQRGQPWQSPCRGKQLHTSATDHAPPLSSSLNHPPTLATPTLQRCCALPLTGDYAATLVTVQPYYDDCVVIGPHVSPGAASQGDTSRPRSLILHDAQEWLYKILNSVGVTVASDAVSDVMGVQVTRPVVRWSAAFCAAHDVRKTSHHILISAKASSAQAKLPAADMSAQAHLSSATNCAFVHIYCQDALTARDVAAEAVEVLLRETQCIPGAIKTRLHPCRTAHLALEEPNFVRHGFTAANAADTVSAMTEDAFVVHLTDVVLRRTHMALVQPRVTADALPIMAALLAHKLKWDRARVTREVALARACIAQCQVTPAR